MTLSPAAQTERSEDWITGVVLHMDPEQDDCYVDVFPEHLPHEIDEALRAARVYGYYPAEEDDGSADIELNEDGSVRYYLYRFDL